MPTTPSAMLLDDSITTCVSDFSCMHASLRILYHFHARGTASLCNSIQTDRFALYIIDLACMRIHIQNFPASAQAPNNCTNARSIHIINGSLSLLHYCTILRLHYCN
ncbi:hypothetical protein GY45DRAFT_889681 [Cubamyces sp. BRFM 1775]|nr:hypothetical protein GY45DRAFT_889681 [Cubamyces sp. BRFM 1775]